MVSVKMMMIVCHVSAQNIVTKRTDNMYLWCSTVVAETHTAMVWQCLVLTLSSPPTRIVPTLLFVVVRKVRVGRFRFRHGVRSPLIANDAPLLIGGDGLFLRVLFLFALALGRVGGIDILRLGLGGGLFTSGVFQERLVFILRQTNGCFEATVAHNKKGTDGYDYTFNVVNGVPSILFHKKTKATVRQLAYLARQQANTNAFLWGPHPTTLRDHTKEITKMRRLSGRAHIIDRGANTNLLQ